MSVTECYKDIVHAGANNNRLIEHNESRVQKSRVQAQTDTAPASLRSVGMSVALSARRTLQPGVLEKPDKDAESGVVLLFGAG